GRGPAGREDVQLRGLDLDLAGRELGVLVPRQPALDGAADADDVLAAQLPGLRRGLRCIGRVEDHLDHAPAVAEVDEDQAAVVAAAGDPAVEVDLLAHVLSPQLAALDRPVATHARASGSSCQATSRWSPPSIGLSWATLRAASPAFISTTQRAPSLLAARIFALRLRSL